MLTTIHLIRHGHSSLTPGREWVDAAGFHRWRDAYDLAGIRSSHPIPADVKAVVDASDVVVASDLRRAVESVWQVAPTRGVYQSALLREVRLPIPQWTTIRAPVRAWDALAHVNWGLRILRGTDPTGPDRQRADEALARLEQLEAVAVSVITHGVFRRVLAVRLVESGWKAIARKRGYRCWSVWSFTNDVSERHRP